MLADDPNQIFQTIIEAFTDLQPRSLGFEERIHPSAVIHPSAQIDPSARIDPQAVIGQKAIIGPGSIIGAGSIIAAGVRIGCDCLLHPRVTVREGCIVHDRVILQPGVVLGGCGFGYRTDERGVHHKLEQRGIVVIEEDVEIGANTTIDRARFGETRIGKGSKIDNQVMLAHGVCIGAHNMIISQSGIAGSTKTGRHVVIAAQVGVMGHLELGDGVQLGARTGVSKSLPSGQYQGAPAMPIRDFQRSIAFIRRGDKRLKALSQRIEALEAKTQSS
jgi:UDP-3-O-[3-hydroxymyristoyl] glucosamine N-acyltransferase